MKKRILALGALLCALLMLVGCVGFADYLDGLADSSASESISEPESESIPEPEPEVDDGRLPDFDFDAMLERYGAGSGTGEPADEGGADAPAESGITGYFAQVDSQLSPQYYPSIQLNADGGFVMMANLYEGMGTIKGTWVQDGSSLTLSVSDRDFSGFIGDDVNTMTLTVVDDDTLSYTGADVGYTQPGATFHRQ